MNSECASVMDEAGGRMKEPQSALAGKSPYTRNEPHSGAAYDFAPAILRVTAEPPSPLPRAVLYLLLGIVGGMLIWATLGRLDIVAVAQGKLVPKNYVQVVQPAESGIVRDILVREGDRVAAGQVLMRMDRKLA
jgi:hemolysin D